jgi:hypothetical protein
MTLVENLSRPSQEQIESWFSEFIHGINVDKLALATSTASRQQTDLYYNAIAGNEREVVKTMRSVSNQYFIRQVTIAFINEIISRKAQPKKLAFSLNSEFKDANFCLDAMIVEESDNIKIPQHYISLQSIIQ